VVRQPRRHADELRSCAEQGTRPMGVERLHVHGPIPARAHDLRQPLRVVLVGLVELHLERGACVPGVQAGDVEPSAAQFMHEPRRHRTGFQPDMRVVSRMPPHHPLDLLRVRGALATPHPAAGLVNHTDRRKLLRNVQTNEPGH